MIPLVSDVNGLSKIDTASLAQRDRFAFWSEVICKNFSPSQNGLEGKPADFSASLSRRTLGPIGLSHIRSTPMTSHRDRQSLRRDPLDCFFFSFLTSGHGRLSQAGRETVQKSGDFLIYDSAAPFVYDWDCNYTGFWMRLPRTLLTNRLPNAGTMTARTVSVTSAMGRLVGGLVQEAHGLDLCADSPAARRVASSLVDLIAAAFETHGGVAPEGVDRHVNLLDKAKSYILANLEDGTLDCDRMVQDLGVSRRTLSRVFAREETTAVRWMWKQRLERSREMLEGGGARRVTEVALACGFSDVSHFSRAFKSEYGLTAKAMLDGRG
ncbi:helix-turn-helix domain-containing protein [Mangrovicoccus sp. HB161399]|uniref:AraC-like ligand-binding domain-containing protein n=1 Tax=Mangrovicoccus sp. HB161399 TaxID=2720392 RepID=UPI001556C172|nr:helix-turn-helix domain-containing protein [Mangrovicoccus sp. HB161399]